MHTTQSNDHIISQDPALIVDAPKPSLKPKLPGIILAVLSLALIAVGGFWYLNGQSFKLKQPSQVQFTPEPVDETVIATVGSERIFAQDLTTKLNMYPQETRESMKPDLKKQLIEDSIILQAGADAGYINLSGEVFDTPTKNQTQRSLLIEQVKKAVNNQAANTQGAYVTIWFMNFKPGPIGYEEGKKLALEKITALHNAVKNGQMTIKQAGQAIENDTSLAQVDPQYKTNAYVEFNTKDKPEGLTFQPEFDKQLLALKVGETTPIFTGQDYEQSDFSQPPKDALYMFGQITGRQEDGDLPFNQWLLEQKPNYEVTEQ